MTSWLQEMNVQLGLSPKAAKMLFQVQGLDNPNKLHVFTDKNVMKSAVLQESQEARISKENSTGEIGVSHCRGEPEASYLSISS